MKSSNKKPKKKHFDIRVPENDIIIEKGQKTFKKRLDEIVKIAPPKKVKK